MENWRIATKLSVLFYIILKYMQGDMKNPPVMVLFILGYLVINTSFYIFKLSKWKLIISIISMSYLYIFGITQNTFLLLLIPISVWEFIEVSNFHWLLYIVLIGTTIYMSPSRLNSEIILICFVSFIIFKSSKHTYMRLEHLANSNDQLKEAENLLRIKLKKEQETDKQSRYTMQLEERNKIAQEIHDKVGHTISGSLMQLEAVKLLVEEDREKARHMLDNVIGVLREGMESIRATLRNIKPEKEELGIQRIKSLLHEYCYENNMKTSFTYKGALDKINYLQWKVINDNVTEALTNTIKYSEAGMIGINIEVLNKFIKVEVKDNGVGVSIIKKGLGLNGIEERTGNLGGKVIIDGSSGFSIIMLLPIQ